MIKKICFCTMSAYFIFLVSITSGQDRHYWSQQYGNRSSLMSGIVIAGDRSASAAFYNPGALGFLKDDSISVSANAYQLQMVSIKDGAGPDLDIDSSEINFFPLLISGVKTFDKFRKNIFAYTLITRNYSSLKASARSDRYTDVIPTLGAGIFEGDENYIAQYLLDANLSEMWGGLSWAHAINKHWSFGATCFLALRTQNQTQSATAFAVNNTQSSRSSIMQTIDFYNFRALAKFGLAGQIGKLKLGLTATTPSVNIHGTGTVAGELSSNNLFLYVDSETGQVATTDLVGTDRQEDLKTTYKTSYAFGFGLEYQVLPKLTIAGAVEYFARVKPYDVISPQFHAFYREFEILENDPSFNSNVILNVKDEAESVTNFGFAAEYGWSDSIKTYLSFCTDKFAGHQSISDKLSLGISNWDIYHVTIGGTYASKKSEIGIGLKYSFGSQDEFLQPINLAGDQIQGYDLFLSSIAKNTTADYQAWTIIVGYNYFF